MKYVKYILLGLLGFMVLFGVIGLFLPSNQTVVREVSINAPASKVFPYANDYRKFNQWSPWAKLDPDTVYTFSGAEQGVGAKMEWSSKHEHVGKGAQEILESRPNEFIKTRLDFGFNDPSTATFTFEESSGTTTVTWTFETYLGNTISRYFGMMLDSWVGESYEKGLSSLKTLVESS